MDKSRLCYNAKLWMETIINNAAVDESSLLRHDIAKALIRVLHACDPLAFHHVAVTVPQCSFSKIKLDPESQEAMRFEANLNLSQLRAIKKCLCYLNLDVPQPESAMQALQVEDYVKPIPIECKEGRGKRRRMSWTAPVDNLLLFDANKASDTGTFECDKLHNAHVILVGDHGQGAFRMMATLLLMTKEKQTVRGRRHKAVNDYIGCELALEVDGQCGHAQCKKDTYQVLKDTVAAPTNESLWNIRNAGKVMTHQCAIYNRPKTCFGNVHATQGVELASCKAELFMTGDLAFCSMVLGKENMAPHWCWRCDMIKQHWTDNVDGPRTGTKWTTDGLKQHRRLVKAGLCATARDVRGVTAPALFNDIEVENILAPSLHNTELFVNEPTKLFLRWIHHRIEQLPFELIDARSEAADLVIKEEEATETLAEATAPIAALKDEVAALRPTKVRNEDRHVFRDDQHKADWEEANAWHAEAKERQAKCKRDLQSIGQALKKAEANVKRIAKKKENGALSQPVRQRMEELLQHVCKTVRSSYHGGDFEGNHCRKFIRNANNVMDSTKELLLATAEED